MGIQSCSTSNVTNLAKTLILAAFILAALILTALILAALSFSLSGHVSQFQRICDWEFSKNPSAATGGPSMKHLRPSRESKITTGNSVPFLAVV